MKDTVFRTLPVCQFFWKWKGFTMNHARNVGTVAAAALLFASWCFGQDSLSVSFKPNGHASMEAGQIVKGFDKNSENNVTKGLITNVWTEKIYAGLGLDVNFLHNTTLSSGFEVKTFNEDTRTVSSGFTRRFYYYFYLTQAELARTFVDDSTWKFKAGGGYFPYKYDDDVRNLGEYLFRSTTYPQTLTTEFDYPFARLAGLYAQGAYSSGINKLKLDLLVTTNTEWLAILDINLSVLASYNLAKIFEIGAGVSFCSILSADESATTPKSAATQYLQGTDTLNYTYRGTKVMGRASLDPKKIFSSTIFGDQDLRLYGEAAVLGIKNYPAALKAPIWYNSILERIPLMVGFNLPAFKILDVFSVEAEWWGNRYPNSLEGVINDGVPLPFRPGTQTIDSTKYKNDNVKWSIYLTKSFAKNYKITLQVADDHRRTFAWDWNRQDWEESLQGFGCWYYVLKFGVMF
jgi:hypothetical protein